MKNIFISGKAGSGKTFAAQHIIENYGHLSIKLADPMYTMYNKYFKVFLKRPVMQYMGTTVGREIIHKDLWARRFQENSTIISATYYKFFGRYPSFICDDVRMLNEWKLLHRMDWLGIYLDSPEDIRIKRLKKRDGDACEELLNHKSETEMDEFKDYLEQVDSSGSLDDMYLLIDTLLKARGAV
jgi:dephospho-CoA kinase